MIIMITTIDDTVYVILLYDIHITYHTDFYQNSVFLVV